MTRFYSVILFVVMTSSGCALHTMQNHAVAVYPYFGSEFLNETENLNVGPLFREYEIGYTFQDRMLQNWLTGGVDTSAMASADAHVEIIRNEDLQRVILFNPEPNWNYRMAPSYRSTGHWRSLTLLAGTLVIRKQKRHTRSSSSMKKLNTIAGQVTI